MKIKTHIEKHILFICFLFLANITIAQTIPPTNDAICSVCVPAGWTIISGSPDVGGRITPGWNSSNNPTFNYVQAPIPVTPTNGHSTFLDGASGEAASTQISGLTSGENYNITIDYGYWIAYISNNNPDTVANNDPNYSINININGTSTVLNLQNVDTWYTAQVPFTATSNSATITINFNTIKVNSMWNLSIGSNAVTKQCPAGNASPPLSANNLTNTCPVETVNLNLLHTGTIPSGATLVWSTDNDSSDGLSSTVTAPNTLSVAGTYYAYYYHLGDDCYSPVSSGVTVTLSSCCNAGTDSPKF